MKKWMLALGIFICSLLFFFAGSLIGYTAHDTKLNSEKSTEKPARKPSKIISPIIGRLAQASGATSFRSTTRTPTPSAVTRARTYIR
jgi:hypothetical protein